MNRTAEIIQNVSRLIDATEQKRVRWDQETQQTYTFVKMDANANPIGVITIQKAEDEYIFRIRNIRNNSIDLLLDTRNFELTSSNAILTTRLRDLYNCIMKQTEDDKYSFFSNIVNDL